MEGEEIELLVSHEAAPEDLDPYEVPLTDAMRGEPFPVCAAGLRGRGVAHRGPGAGGGDALYEYEPSTRGPPEAHALIAPKSWDYPSLRDNRATWG